MKIMPNLFQKRFKTGFACLEGDVSRRPELQHERGSRSATYLRSTLRRDDAKPG